MQLRFFPAFFDRPEKIRFSEQEADEQIELLLREHFITNVPWIVFSLIAAVLPFILFNLRDLIGLTFLTSVPPQLLLSSLTLWYLLILAYIIENFLHWYFNIYIVTNIHVEDINFESLLSRDITEAEIIDIESASSKIQGVIRSLFNFGDVNIETAAKAQQITFGDVPYPDRVVDRINDIKANLPGRQE